MNHWQIICIILLVLNVALTLIFALKVAELRAKKPKTSDLQDFERVLLVLCARQHGMGVTDPEGGDVQFMMNIFNWEERRVRMAFAMLEEFEFAQKGGLDHGP